MGEEFTQITGGCMCGEVRYEADREPVTVSYCHCYSCRRHTGAPVVTFVVFERDQVKFTKEDRKIYNSSPGVERGFCGQCGTSLTCEGEYMGRPMIGFHISTLDNPDAYVPIVHQRHGERIDWFDVADNLPRLRGGSDDKEPYHIGPVIGGPTGEPLGATGSSGLLSEVKPPQPS